MKNYILLLFIILITYGFAPEDSNGDKAKAEASIKGFYTALEKQDLTALKAFCTPGFHAIENGQMISSLNEFIEKANALFANSPKFNLKFVKTDLSTDMGMSIVRLDASLTKNNYPIHLKAIENYLLKKVEGKWLIDFFQSTHLSDARKLEKGNIMGIHLLNGIEMKPGVTKEQVEHFVFHRFVPAFNNLTGEIQVIPLRGLRGENKDKLGFIMFLSSDDVRNSLWSDEGVLTPKGQEVFNKLEPVLKEQDKLFINNHDPYTDWRVE